MKRFIILIFSVVLFSCNGNKNIPDVSPIEVNIELKRFEQDFFAIDTNNVAASIQSLLKKYPAFTQDFIRNILGLNMDSLLMPVNYQHDAVRRFINDYQPIKDSSDLMYKDFEKETKEIKEALRFVKYYFPDYPLPKAVITFIGPLDASFLTSFGTQGDILTPEGLGIGLQLHLGSNFSFYQSPAGQTLYPKFISNNFDRKHITVNSMRNIIDDMYADNATGKALIEQMIVKGRKLYLLSKILPRDADYLIMGYTEKEMKAAYENEEVVWDFFLNNDLLNNAEQNLIKNYIGESPKTQEFGENSPGNLGSFSGWQIVKKYMEKYPETTLAELMQMSPREIYSLSKYKPR